MIQTQSTNIFISQWQVQDNHIFSISPRSGTLLPGQQRAVHFSYRSENEERGSSVQHPLQHWQRICYTEGNCIQFICVFFLKQKAAVVCIRL